VSHTKKVEWIERLETNQDHVRMRPRRAAAQVLPESIEVFQRKPDRGPAPGSPPSRALEAPHCGARSPAHRYTPTKTRAAALAPATEDRS